jgi:hypothetical protein
MSGKVIAQTASFWLNFGARYRRRYAPIYL